MVPHLDALGVSHLYLSPILQAVPGSTHGYDVVDHTRVSDELGGRAAFEELAATAQGHGLGIVVDVVPNHMAFVAPEHLNQPLWQVLRDGRDAPTAHWFDIDWRAGGGRIGLPLLGDELDAVLARGEIVVDRVDGPGHGDLVLRYHEHVLPVAIGTEGTGDAAAQVGDTDEAVVRAVLDRQHYRLASWRDKASVLNYRRFFEVDQLIAVRVELEDVFVATHRLLLELHQAGLVDGFRIDHPDGLADPAAYLDLLRRHTRRDTPVWVEKILEGTERLPGWACAGTTGYDGLRAITAALVDTAAAPVLSAAWEAAGGEHTLAEAAEAAKRQVVAQSLAPELERLVRRAREVLPGRDPERLREAVTELLVAGQVYRAYVRPDEALTGEARQRLAQAFATARARRPDLEPELFDLVPLTAPEGTDEAARDFSTRLQQTWGPVMAKGVEDTLFYRFHRLVALNEVGGDPDDLDGPGPELLHAWAARQQAAWPAGMVASSTHDTKRSEDVRARILAVAGDTEAWRECSEASLRLAAAAGVDAETAHLVWQTLVGVGTDVAPERLDAYLRKSVREAKQHTAWVDGDASYEDRVVAFAEQARTEGPLRAAVERALARNAEAIRAVVLAQVALRLTLPGVPDTYQGCERLALALVDPDNRRPVDYDDLAAALARLDAGRPDESVAGGLSDEKLHVTRTLLRFRRRNAARLPTMTYQPLPATTDHAVGFVRATPVPQVAGLRLGRQSRLATVVTRAPARLAASGGWGDATVRLDAGEWVDLLTGRPVVGGDVALATLLDRLPVAVLVS